MTITLPPDIEGAILVQAKQRGTTLEVLVHEALREKFAPVSSVAPKPTDPADHEEWMNRLRSIAVDCGVSLSNEAVGREAMYD